MIGQVEPVEAFAQDQQQEAAQSFCAQHRWLPAIFKEQVPQFFPKSHAPDISCARFSTTEPIGKPISEVFVESLYLFNRFSPGEQGRNDRTRAGPADGVEIIGQHKVRLSVGGKAGFERAAIFPA